jgi:hypothetical protein
VGTTINGSFNNLKPRESFVRMVPQMDHGTKLPDSPLATDETISCAQYSKVQHWRYFPHHQECSEMTASRKPAVSDVTVGRKSHPA